VRRVTGGPSGNRRRRATAWVLAAVLLSAAAACTGSPPKLDPANTPNNVVASADRIRDGQLRLGGSADCLISAYCATGLSRVYGINLGSGGVQLATPTAVIEALTAGAIDVGVLPGSAVFPGDDRITVMHDDRALWPADNIVPVTSNAAVVDHGPALATAVDAISSALTQSGLDTIEQALDGGAPPDVAASTWLRSYHPTAATPPAVGDTKLVIGARDDDESEALSDIYAGALTMQGWTTTVKQLDGSRPAELDTLELGQIDLIPDQMADLLEFLDGFTGQAGADTLDNTVLLRSALADDGLLAFDPAPAEVQTVFALSRSVATALGTTTLSDLARVSGGRLPPPALPTTLTPAEVAQDGEGPLTSPPTRLGVGSAGTLVAFVEERLFELGYQQSAPTATFDEATRREVVAFQADHGLITDGEVDQATLRALGAAEPTTNPTTAPLPGQEGTISPPDLGPDAGPAGTIYLAFASGPSGVTPQIVQLLSRVGGQATFFADGDAAVDNAQTLDDLAAAGDAVGVSMPPHDSASPVAEAALLADVPVAQENVAAAVGRAPTCLLLPYGALDSGTAGRVTADGLHPVLWNLDPQDWRHPGATAIAADVIANARPGSIVLLHDGGGDLSQTVVALQSILPTLTALGYNFAALPGC
jgi:glycine betaine/choline ABC-type transport system substrate-binding protein/peptidoglycan/xylan/chitin deacetylase (PgdA/CDA1 family)